jgi:hypothetical protein
VSAGSRSGPGIEVSRFAKFRSILLLNGKSREEGVGVVKLVVGLVEIGFFNTFFESV